ncbi:hypothetical protein Ple7327_2761 [Pleurocapsa sp. PCC 7327]|uniref:hypothetical protein n=1 Tax=Pleurocapsa sp. PCC 7327 TaxID=118163 RepID=UPI00029FBE55|nr:hypothetical protein [Pleurocapsa sp. PCC 7327]AFY78030.1 hypothetical protein Ple7327_2761 [Pleurocapsa sp. PCC 7327]
MTGLEILAAPLIKSAVAYIGTKAAIFKGFTAMAHGIQHGYGYTYFKGLVLTVKKYGFAATVKKILEVLGILGLFVFLSETLESLLKDLKKLLNKKDPRAASRLVDTMKQFS